jgi:hypothetical protein
VDAVSLYYDRQGEPITLDQWSELRDDPDYFRLGSTHIGPLWISTVWLGLDHSFSWPGHEREPLIFETMVFDQSAEGMRKYDDLDMERYTTEEQALLGHAAMVTKVTNTRKDDL